MLTHDRVKGLYEKYLALVQFEVDELGCKPTEVRHLIGRLGEFYAALHVEGELAHTPNQHGFDVIAKDGRKISVKTTAQKNGFVPIKVSTLQKVDDLMVLQYQNSKLCLVYYGPISKAVESARRWKDQYELDISKARKIT